MEVSKGINPRKLPHKLKAFAIGKTTGLCSGL